MEGLVYLSGEYPDLAVAELRGAMRSLQTSVGIAVEGHPLTLLDDRPPAGLAGRMGLCHFTGIRVVKTGTSLEEVLDGARRAFLELDGKENVSFKIRARSGSLPFTREELFGSLERIAQEMSIRVTHRNPDRKLFVIEMGGVHLGWVTEDSDRRRIDEGRIGNMPFTRPIVMGPRLARAMVNLSGLAPGSRIIDPFFGPGELAFQAADIGMKVTGIERDEEIFHGALENIRHLGLSSVDRLVLGDSRTVLRSKELKAMGPFDGCITDPPFGRSASTRGERPEELIHQVMEATWPLLKEDGVMVIDVSDPKILSGIRGTNPESAIPVRIHRSLTRYISTIRRG